MAALVAAELPSLTDDSVVAIVIPNHLHTMGRGKHLSASSTTGVTQRACSARVRASVGIRQAVRNLPASMDWKLGLNITCHEQALLSELLNQAPDVGLDYGFVGCEFVRHVVDDGWDVPKSLQQLPRAGTGFVQTEIDSGRQVEQDGLAFQNLGDNVIRNGEACR